MAILITVAPLDAIAETRPTLAFCNVDDERVAGLNGQIWWPGITQLPAMNKEAWNGDWHNGDGLVSSRRRCAAIYPHHRRGLSPIHSSIQRVKS